MLLGLARKHRKYTVYEDSRFYIVIIIFIVIIIHCFLLRVKFFGHCLWKIILMIIVCNLLSGTTFSGTQ